MDSQGPAPSIMNLRCTGAPIHQHWGYGTAVNDRAQSNSPVDHPLIATPLNFSNTCTSSVTPSSYNCPQGSQAYSERYLPSHLISSDDHNLSAAVSSTNCEHDGKSKLASSSVKSYHQPLSEDGREPAAVLREPYRVSRSVSQNCLKLTSSARDAIPPRIKCARRPSLSSHRLWDSTPLSFSIRQLPLLPSMHSQYVEGLPPQSQSVQLPPPLSNNVQDCHDFHPRPASVDFCRSRRFSGDSSSASSATSPLFGPYQLHSHHAIPSSQPQLHRIVGRQRFPKHTGLDVTIPPLKLPSQDGSHVALAVLSNDQHLGSDTCHNLNPDTDETQAGKAQQSPVSDSSHLSHSTEKCLLTHPVARGVFDEKSEPLWRFSAEEKVSTPTHSCKKNTVLHDHRLRTMFRMLRATAFRASLTGRKQDWGWSENQDSCFSVPVQPQSIRDACCHGVCDGHGVHGAVIAATVTRLLEGAFTFVVESFLTLLSLQVSDVQSESAEWASGHSWLHSDATYQIGRQLAQDMFGESALCNVVEDGHTIPSEVLFKQAMTNFLLAVEEYVETLEGAERSGCTLATLLRLGPQVWVVWVGDSKVVGYEYRWAHDHENESDNDDNADPARVLAPFTAVATRDTRYLSHFPGRIDRHVCLGTEEHNVGLRFRMMFETEDHCPFAESSRILSAGGSVICSSTHLQRPTYRIQPTGIAMSRSFGDVASTAYGLSHDPDIVCLSVPWREDGGPESWNWAFVVGTDGLWDTTGLDEVAKDLVAGILIDVLESFVSMTIAVTYDEDEGDHVDFWDPKNSFYLDYHVQSLVWRSVHINELCFCVTQGRERIQTTSQLSQKRREQLEGYCDDTSALVCFIA